MHYVRVHGRGTGVDEKVKAREEGETEEGRRRWNNRKVVKRGCCGRQVEAEERACGKYERKLGPGSFKPASTTRDFAVYVLCRVDTRRDILTRQSAAVARRVGISPGWYVYDRQRRSQLGRGIVGCDDSTKPFNRPKIVPFATFPYFFYIIPQRLSTIKLSSQTFFKLTIMFHYSRYFFVMRAARRSVFLYLYTSLCYFIEYESENLCKKKI